MNDRLLKYGVQVVIGLSCAFLFYGAFSMPGYLTDIRVLGGLIFLEVLVAILWNYRQRFFVALIVAFLWAGTSVPLRGVWTSARWAVLAAGACVGAIIYLRDHRHRLGLVLLCVDCDRFRDGLRRSPVGSPQSSESIPPFPLWSYGSSSRCSRPKR